jgi:hypothetical protein
MNRAHPRTESARAVIRRYNRYDEDPGSNDFSDKHLVFTPTDVRGDVFKISQQTSLLVGYR